MKWRFSWSDGLMLSFVFFVQKCFVLLLFIFINKKNVAEYNITTAGYLSKWGRSMLKDYFL